MVFRKRNEKSSTDLQSKARQSGDVFKVSGYFAEAEPAMDWQLHDIITPFLARYRGEIDYTSVLDFAAGHGRNSAWLQEPAKDLTLVDINKENVKIWKERFGTNKRFTYLITDGASLKGIKNNSITFLYSFDSMVHFDNDVITAYIPEFWRVLKQGCYGFCHHSNYTGNPGGRFQDNPDWRNFMSKELFAHTLIKNGFEVVEQMPLAWGGIAELDCITLFRKPRERRMIKFW